ncbi:SRP-independent targeting protein 3 [Trypanosoma melophagium]|uniref:SRP-independent targeting protein 3 n=1 Tax=Trypanosoma melophagium TaxID=715481 RepID=UPI00351AAD68|nr:SRP-independent targeting protein 3 [Trypanosoma melophagium]
MTVMDYDFSRWRDLFFKQLLLPMVVGFFVAYRWSTPFPLLLQTLNNPSTLCRSPLFQLHVQHWPEEGSLQRPWKENSVVPAWMQKMWQESQAEGETAAGSGTANTKGKRRKL